MGSSSLPRSMRKPTHSAAARAHGSSCRRVPGSNHARAFRAGRPCEAADRRVSQPRLALRAQAAGHGESSHVVWMNKAGWKDWELKQFIIDGDWTFVTINSVDFRGPQANPGSAGQYADVEIHAGLICFNGPDHIDKEAQHAMLDAALQIIEDEVGEIVNKVIEITLTDDGIEAETYLLPFEGQ